MFFAGVHQAVFSFVASAVQIFTIAIPSPAQSNVALRVVSVDVRQFRGLATEAPKRSVSIETNKEAGRHRLEALM